MSAKVFVGDPPPFDQNVFELCPGRALLLHTVAVGTCKVLYDATIKVFVFLDVNRGRVGFPRLEPGLNRLCPPFAVVPLAKKTDGVLQPCCCTAAVRLTTQPSFHDHWGGELSTGFQLGKPWPHPEAENKCNRKNPPLPPPLQQPPPHLQATCVLPLGVPYRLAGAACGAAVQHGTGEGGAGAGPRAGLPAAEDAQPGPAAARRPTASRFGTRSETLPLGVQCRTLFVCGFSLPSHTCPYPLPPHPTHGHLLFHV